MFVSEDTFSAGRIFRYNLESKQQDIIYSQGALIQGLTVIGTDLWFTEMLTGIKSIPTSGGAAVTVSTTGLGSCKAFLDIYFATGK